MKEPKIIAGLNDLVRYGVLEYILWPHKWHPALEVWRGPAFGAGLPAHASRPAKYVFAELKTSLEGCAENASVRRRFKAVEQRLRPISVSKKRKRSVKTQGEVAA